MDREKSDKLRNFLNISEQVYKNLLGYYPQKTHLLQLTPKEWKAYCLKYCLNYNSNGIFLPRNRTAVLRTEIETFPLNLFHEYFGHGLFCEQSLQGEKIVELEARLMEEEKKYFCNKFFNLKEIQDFRSKNKIYKKIVDFKKQNLATYECFAIWTEFFLSKKFCLMEIFEKKFNCLNIEEQDHISDIISFNIKFGNLATFYMFGLSKLVTIDRVKKLIEDIYRDKLRDIRFAVVYGSKMPYNDLDIYIVGNNPIEVHSDWLDIKMKSIKEFEKGVCNFDVRICVPLMTGEFIFGDRQYFNKSKLTLINQPITDEAIKHNFKWHARMERLKEKNLQNIFLETKFSNYSKTYKANALLLRKGRKVFKKSDLMEIQI